MVWLAIAVSSVMTLGSATLRDGDVIFQESTSAQSTAIRDATQSPVTHVGVVVWQNGTAKVLEASGETKLTPLKTWIDRGVGARYAVRRIKGRRLTDTELMSMRTLGRKLRGTPYDAKFDWSDDELYCSELVWKLYARGAGIVLSEPETFSDLALHKPAVRALIRRRYRKRKLPMAMPVVTPKALYVSGELETVWDSL